MTPAPARDARASKPLGISAKSAAGAKINGLGRFHYLGDDDGERRRRILAEEWGLQRAGQVLLPEERVAQCQRSLSNFGLDIRRNRETGRARLDGVICCESRWHCVICAARLTERDRHELQLGIAMHARAGGAVYLATFTFPHDVTLQLGDGLAKMQEAQRRMKATRRYKSIMEKAGALGSVKALEVTYGANGWHPHVHMLIFARADQDRRLEHVRELWAEAVEYVGLGRVNEHGFDLRGGDFAADYVAKFGKEPGRQSRAQARAWWTASHELTKGHTKQTQRMKGATPFTLLRWWKGGDTQAAFLFIEYAEAFKGRAQLYWSPGLRAKLDLLELQDSPPERDEEFIAHVGADEWRVVLRFNKRGELLDAAELDGARALGGQWVKTCLAAWGAGVDPPPEGAHHAGFSMFDFETGRRLGPWVPLQ